jgi:glycosyltransferase involved in cell wall biosynthesis
VISINPNKRSHHIPLSRLGKYFISMLEIYFKSFFENQTMIFIEDIPSIFVRLKCYKIVIPNQEWIRSSLLANISNCNEVWCKTNYAHDIFTKLGYNAKYMGFTSLDRKITSIEKNYNSFVHVAGQSPLKGTRGILEVWIRNPTWPNLVVITSWTHLSQEYPSNNIIFFKNKLSDFELSELFNYSGIHLCLSETEGFGHYIMEALSTSSIVVTTNAPPMNEIVSKDHGFLVDYTHKKKAGYGEKFYFCEIDFEKKINKIIAMSIHSKMTVGKKARAKYEQKTLEFIDRLKTLEVR